MYCSYIRTWHSCVDHLLTPQYHLTNCLLSTVYSSNRKDSSSSKGNSLPHAKRFDNTMVDDDFEKLQRSISEENVIQHHFHGWTAVMVPCAGPVLKSFTHFFVSAFISLGAKPHCNSLKSSSTLVKSHHLVGGRLLPLLRIRLEDLAILLRLTAGTFSNWASTRNEHRC